jgi:hypothetical protein
VRGDRQKVASLADSTVVLLRLWHS